MPFKPSTWSPRTSPPGLVGLLNDGYLSPHGDDVLFASCTSVFVTGPDTNDEVQVNQAVVSTDKAVSWTQIDVPNETKIRFFAINAPGGVRYFRVRKRFGRSIFVGSPDLFSGHVALDWSDDAVFWSERQKFYTWPHTVPAGGARADNLIDARHLFIPGSGPAGADADWLLIRCLVSAGGTNHVDAYDWWRSDDFGETWTNVRTQGGSFAGAVTNYLKRSPAGRLVASTGAPLFFSDDGGVTWSSAGGALPGQIKTHAEPQAGSTWVLTMSGGLSSQAAGGISCDDGGSWSGGANFNAQNSNCFLLRLGPSETLVFVRDSDLTPTGCNIWYSTNGGEAYSLVGLETRLPGLQTSVAFAGLFSDGHPVAVASTSTTLVSDDQPTGNFTARTTCPLAFAGLKKAGIPNLCGHPMLQNKC